MGIIDLNPDHITEDEFADGSLLMIEKAFNQRADKWYTYAAIKVHGKWYVTGFVTIARETGMNTQEFVAWLTRGSRLMPPPRLYWAKVVYQL